MPLIEHNNGHHNNTNGHHHSSSNGSIASNTSVTLTATNGNGVYHKRQGSNGYNKHEQSPMQTSFSSLDNFMTVTKQMEDEIMVPSKLKDKAFEHGTQAPSVTAEGCTSDALDHYRFICLVRDQFLECEPFSSDLSTNESKCKILNNNVNFQKTLEQVKHHYGELMALLDELSNEAKSVTNVYKMNV